MLALRLTERTYQLNKHVHINWTYWCISAEQTRIYQLNILIYISWTNMYISIPVWRTPQTPWIVTWNNSSSFLYDINSIILHIHVTPLIHNLGTKWIVLSHTGTLNCPCLTEQESEMLLRCVSLNQVWICPHCRFEDWEARSYNLVRVYRRSDKQYVLNLQGKLSHAEKRIIVS